ncbi:AIPR family protein [Kocuria palustris]|uniref:AIPR family protein n=2 Tax=Bacteria TaxID=2 RepID=UPI0009EE27E7|nr:AIPR family protein [Kocuria palustris]
MQDDFFRALQEDIDRRASAAGKYTLEAMTEVLAERLEDAEEVFNLTTDPVSCRGRRNKVLEILGYAEDGGDDSLVVLAGKHTGDPDASLSLTEAKRIFSAAAGFLEQSADGSLESILEPSSKEADYATFFREMLANRVQRIRFYLLTDAVKSTRIKEIPGSDVAGVEATYQIWDRTRFEELASSETGREEMSVDFTQWLPDGLPLLKSNAVEDAEQESDNPTFVGVVPGKVLADVYREHGTRLLESNVRTFLSARGKVNRGIQRTLIHKPQMFLAFNNGLATTATAITSVDDGPVAYVHSIDNWQIVNGGQTTASLLHFLRQKSTNQLDDVAVQMKLVLVTAEENASQVAEISRNANSQNSVNEADFFSNSDYHRQMSTHSKRVKPPRKGAAQYSTRWFYERARGEYDTLRGNTSGARQRDFDLQNPKSQRISKTDWAKYLNAWDQKPHIVSKGAQTNFVEFANAVNDAWEKNRNQFGESYFRESVGKAILFNSIRAHVRTSPWYLGGYLANITAYTMAKVSKEIEQQFPGYEFDFELVWRDQQIHDSARPVIDSVGQTVQSVLTSPSRGQANVTQWAKQEACWAAVKNTLINLPRTFEASLVSREDKQQRNKASAGTQKLDNEFELIGQMVAIPSETWRDMLEDGSQNGLLTEKQIALIRRFGLTGRPANHGWEASTMKQAVDQLIEHGIVSSDVLSSS